MAFRASFAFMHCLWYVCRSVSSVFFFSRSPPLPGRSPPPPILCHVLDVLFTVNRWPVRGTALGYVAMAESIPFCEPVFCVLQCVLYRCLNLIALNVSHGSGQRAKFDSECIAVCGPGSMLWPKYEITKTISSVPSKAITFFFCGFCTQ